MQVNGHFLPLKYSCCNLLQNCKDTLFTPAFGLFGAVFLWNTAKPLFFLISFIVSVFNAHRKSVKRFFARYSSAPRCRARDTYITMTIAKYVCIIHFRRFNFRSTFTYLRKNLIYGTLAKRLTTSPASHG